MEVRWEHHQHMLEDGRHPNHRLQKAANDHPDKFAFIILEFVEPDLKYRREQVWFDRMMRHYELFNLDLSYHDNPIEKQQSNTNGSS